MLEYVRVHVCGCISVCMCGGLELRLDVLLDCSSLCLLRQGLSLNPKLTISGECSSCFVPEALFLAL